MGNNQLYELLKIGLTEGESKVYLALLELGSSTVGPIVKKANVAYSNVYGILDRLIKKGITSYIVKHKIKYFQAAGPKNLYDYINKKEQQITEQKEALKNMLPGLIQLQQNKPEQEAEIFIGKKGLKSAYEKFFSNINSKNIYYFFYIHKKDYSDDADRFYWNMFNDTLKGKNLTIKGISNIDFKKSWFLKKAKKRMSMRYVDFPTPGNIDICRDKIMLISWANSPVCFLIKSERIAEDFKNYFNMLFENETRNKNYLRN